MIYHTPKYYGEFSCRASACSDSCCRAGWEIPIDPESYEFYKSAGMDIDKNIYVDLDGDRVFLLRKDGACPYLRADGLCGIYIETGGRLCEICAKYPRFFEEYDGFAEAGISVSCPAAAELALGLDENPYTDIIHETPDRLLDFLVKTRARAMEMIYGEDDPDRAAEKLYGYTVDLQDLIDGDELEAIDAIGFEPFEAIGRNELCELKRRILGDTEILTRRWRELLSEDGSHSAGTALQKRNYLAYLTYRYFLKAINTEYLSGQGAFITALYRLAEALGDDYIENIRLIAKEIGHNAGNYETVLEMLAD